MNQTIYIRKANWEHFKDEPDKSALVNNLLALHYNQPVKTPARMAAHSTYLSPVSSTDKPEGKPVSDKVIEDVAKVAGTEFGCCNKANPCKHWVFNSSELTWTNTLSGRKREVSQ